MTILLRRWSDAGIDVTDLLGVPALRHIGDKTFHLDPSCGRGTVLSTEKLDLDMPACKACFDYDWKWAAKDAAQLIIQLEKSSLEELKGERLNGSGFLRLVAAVQHLPRNNDPVVEKVVDQILAEWQKEHNKAYRLGAERARRRYARRFQRTTGRRLSGKQGLMHLQPLDVMDAYERHDEFVERIALWWDPTPMEIGILLSGPAEILQKLERALQANGIRPAGGGYAALTAEDTPDTIQVAFELLDPGPHPLGKLERALQVARTI